MHTPLELLPGCLVATTHSHDIYQYAQYIFPCEGLAQHITCLQITIPSSSSTRFWRNSSQILWTTCRKNHSLAGSIESNVCSLQWLHWAKKNCRLHELTASERRSSKMGGSHCPCWCGARSKDRLMASGTNLFCCHSWSIGMASGTSLFRYHSWSIGIEQCRIASLHLDCRHWVQLRWGSDRKASSPLKTFLAAGSVTFLYKGELCSEASVPVLASSQNRDAGPPILAASLAASTFRPNQEDADILH